MLQCEMLLVATVATPAIASRQRRSTSNSESLAAPVVHMLSATTSDCDASSAFGLDASAAVRIVGPVPVPVPRGDPFTTAILTVRSLVSLQANWNSHGAPPPSSLARLAAEAVVMAARRRMLSPVAVAPSSEGGVAVCFANTPALYVDIECFNDGELVAIVSRKGHDPETWVLGSDRLEATLDRINAALA